MCVDAAKRIYIRKQLGQALERIWQCPLTVVEAPMGYGKTTAVKEFLKDQAANVLWQTLADSSASGFWRGFCRLIKKINVNCADRLAELGVPTDSVFLEKALEIFETIEFPAKRPSFSTITTCCRPRVSSGLSSGWQKWLRPICILSSYLGRLSAKT